VGVIQHDASVGCRVCQSGLTACRDSSEVSTHVLKSSPCPGAGTRWRWLRVLRL